MLPSIRISNHQRGIALIAVLGFLGVVSAIAIAIAEQSHYAVKSALRSERRLQMEQAIESVTDQEIEKILTRTGAGSQSISAIQKLKFAHLDVEYRTRPESAKVDLNYADEATLAAVLRAVKIEDDQSVHLAAAIADWRDFDDFVRLNGAEANAYRDAGFSYGPDNTPFRSLDDLARVLGISENISECLRPYLTIYSRVASIDVKVADPRLRDAFLGPSVTGNQQSGSLIAGSALNVGGVYEITVKVRDSSIDLERVRRTIVRITGNPREPFHVLALQPIGFLSQQSESACAALEIAAAQKSGG